MRASDVNFPLFLHVLGALVLVGGLFTGGLMLALAGTNERMLRIGYRSLLVIALPGFLLMRIAAQWVYSRAGWDELPDDQEPAWLAIGFILADLGGILFLVSLVVGGIGVVRLRKGSGSGLLKVSMAISLLLLAAYVVAVWAMSAKPD